MNYDYDPENPHLPPEEKPVFGVPRFVVAERIGGWAIVDNLYGTYLKDFNGRFRVFKRRGVAQSVADLQNERCQDV